MNRLCLGNLFTVFSRRNVSIMSSRYAAADGNVKSGDNRSVHSDSIEEVHNVPMHVIVRPIPSVLDEQKVQSLMDTIKVDFVSFVGFDITKEDDNPPAYSTALN